MERYIVVVDRREDKVIPWCEDDLPGVTSHVFDGVAMAQVFAARMGNEGHAVRLEKRTEVLDTEAIDPNEKDYSDDWTMLDETALSTKPYVLCTDFRYATYHENGQGYDYGTEVGETNYYSLEYSRSLLKGQYCKDDGVTAILERREILPLWEVMGDEEWIAPYIVGFTEVEVQDGLSVTFAFDALGSAATLARLMSENGRCTRNGVTHVTIWRRETFTDVNGKECVDYEDRGLDATEDEAAAAAATERVERALIQARISAGRAASYGEWRSTDIPQARMVAVYDGASYRGIQARWENMGGTISVRALFRTGNAALDRSAAYRWCCEHNSAYRSTGYGYAAASGRDVDPTVYRLVPAEEAA